MINRYVKRVVLEMISDGSFDSEIHACISRGMFDDIIWGRLTESDLLADKVKEYVASNSPKIVPVSEGDFLVVPSDWDEEAVRALADSMKGKDFLGIIQADNVSVLRLS